MAKKSFIKSLSEKTRKVSKDISRISEGKELKKIEKTLKKLAKSKAVSRRVLKPSRVTIKISKPKPVEDMPSHFFNKEMEETKRSLFFK